MCDPVAGIMIASFAINVGSKIASANAQGKAAEANAEAARRAMHETWTDIGGMERELAMEATQGYFQLEKAENRKQAVLRANAGEASVTGISVEELSGDLERQAAELQLAQRRGYERDIEQLGREKISGRTIAQARIASVQGANPWLTALQIGGDTAATAAYFIQNPPQFGSDAGPEEDDSDG